MYLRELTSGPRPVLLSTCLVAPDLRLLVLAPHPDDFDEIGVTMRFFQSNGNPIFVAVLSSGASGVEDSFSASSSSDTKAQLREQEQRESCRFFGLPDSHLTFLRLTEDSEGHIAEDSGNCEEIRSFIHRIRPAIVFLPHGNDTNTDHQRVYALFVRVATEALFPFVSLLNRDPKTISMRHDLIAPFGSAEAEWKASLLRLHKSQQQRNLNTRGVGFDERILEMNRQIARECDSDQEFAEAFEFVSWE
ncbi:MAG: PIG-L family deacetylase [Chloroflexi bacterium]|nr:PIG-L family deacetylase [Chloroflexota bacterium]